MTVNSRRREERLYIAVLPAFLAALVALGLLGVPALLVGALGLLVGALAIAAFRRRLEAWGPRGSRPGRGQTVPSKYVPRVLESSSTRRRRLAPRRRQRHSTPPLRFR